VSKHYKIALIDKSLSQEVHSILSNESCKNIIMRVSFYFKKQLEYIFIYMNSDMKRWLFLSVIFKVNI
jgi:hypothetical protein